MDWSNEAPADVSAYLHLQTKNHCGAVFCRTRDDSVFSLTHVYHVYTVHLCASQ